MKKFKFLTLLLVLVLALTACKSPSSGDNSDDGSKKGGNDSSDLEITYTHPTDLEGEIDFWSWDPMFEDVIKEFNKVYPNIKVNLSVIELGELHDKLQTTITSGRGAPDVSHVEQFQFTRFQAPGLLEDFLQPQYNIQRYQDLQTEYNWERWKSVDGKRLLGIPWDLTLGVFYYRTDIYEQMGLPTDPVELGEFLQDVDNVLFAAQTLAANGIYMYEFRDSPAIQYGDATGYFDSDLNYMRNNERMIELLDIVKRGVQIGWAPQMSALWSDEGKKLTQQGKIASFPAGTNGSRHLKDIFPEQSGKWNVTRMPLGVNTGLGGSTFVIPSQSDSKDAAWAFLEWINLAEEPWKIYTEHAVQPGWKHITQLDWYKNHTNEYLNGAKDYAFYETLVDEIPVRRLTPLDGPAWPLYIDKINEAIDKNIDSRTILQQIEDNTLKQLAPEIEKLKEQMAANE
jgi:multiple sugar transport system substrate-binding protein